MMNPALLEGLQARVVETPRLHTHIITRGDPAGEPVILVHGNMSAARFFEELMLRMPERYYLIAPDMRGYGRSEQKPVDATRAMRDFSDDLYALVQTLGLQRPHLLGWSLGGNIVIQYAIDYPAELASLTLVAPGSPYGFGGSHGLDGKPNNEACSGSGGGTANPALVEALRNKDRSSASPVSPRVVMNNFFFKPPFRTPREEVFLDEILLMAVEEQFYPGDFTPVEPWPNVGPGTRGPNNALSPKYMNQMAFSEIDPRPPVLWLRGDSDQIVSDTSLFEFGFLGQIGAVPGWPGTEVYPTQPMVSQMRAVLECYQAGGGIYQEVVLADCGHSPHIEKPTDFDTAFLGFLAAYPR